MVTTEQQKQINEKADQLADQDVYYCVSSLMEYLLKPKSIEKLPCEYYEDACKLAGYDLPSGDEIFEYWIISDYLFKALDSLGEIVVDDFFGLTIWGRQTTGQSISSDGVIEKIAADILEIEYPWGDEDEDEDENLEDYEDWDTDKDEF